MTTSWGCGCGSWGAKNAAHKGPWCLGWGVGWGASRGLHWRSSWSLHWCSLNCCPVGRLTPHCCPLSLLVPPILSPGTMAILRPPKLTSMLLLLLLLLVTIATIHLLLLLVVGRVGRGLLSVLRSGGHIDPLGRSIWRATGSPLLVSCIHGCLEMGVKVRVNVLGDVGGYLRCHGWNGTWDWLLIVLFEPLHEVIYTAMILVPVPESIRGDSHIFNPWFSCRLIGQHKLPRILL